MIINSVKIKNYGIYYGENIYDFSITDPNKNIILIYGKNGSGKTTLLESIKKSFYGCSFYGLKNPNKLYYNNIISKFNSTAFNEGERESYIEICFQWKEENNINIYKFKRSWNIEEKNEEKIVFETLKITKNDIVLSKKDTEETENFFRTVFPQKIFDFFFFDGEDVKKLISTNYIEKELKEAIYTLFNIDIFKSMDNNLISYIRNRNKNKDLDKDEVFLFELEDKKQKFELEIFKLKEEIFNLKLDEDNIKGNLKKRKQRFKNIGGDIYEKKTTIEKEIVELEYIKNKDTEMIKTNIINDISLFINLDLLKNAFIQSTKEIDSKEYKILLNQLKNGSLGELLISSLKNKINENDLETLISKFEKKVTESDDNIHNLSSENLLKLKEKINQLKKLSTEVNKIVKERRENQGRLNLLKEQLNSLNKNTEFEKLLDEIQVENSKLHILLEKIIKNENILKDKEFESIDLNNQIKKQKDLIINGRKNHNKFNVVYKIQNVLDKYIKRKNEEQMEAVKNIFIENFNSLHRKVNFIKNVEINPTTFEIKLFNNFGEVKNELLSTGEKQVYILSLLGAFLKASGKEIPLVFDTLLGRLDEDHREKIITKYLPTVSKQVLILSTDSEITEENYKLLLPYITKEYSLEYNSLKESVNILTKGEK